jgi:tetratricopeptide (TPR) repeat protein
MKKTSNSFLIETISDDRRIALPVKGRAGGIPSPGLYHGLIISSALVASQQEQKLIRLADIAYGQRNIQALESLSIELCGLSSDSARDAGMYYAAIAAKRNGQFDFARSILESLIDSPTFGARATQTLGALYYDSGNAHQAMPLFAEAARSSDLFAKFGALIQSSAIKSQAGQHEQALNDLENLWPIVRVASVTHPHLFYTYHNELAYELAQMGRLQEAAKHSSVACASPVASAYIEWQETREEIREEISARESATVVFVVPDLKRAEKKENKIASGNAYYCRPKGHSDLSAAPIITAIVMVSLTLSRLECCHQRRGPPSPFRK